MPRFLADEIDLAQRLTSAGRGADAVYQPSVLSWASAAAFSTNRKKAAPKSAPYYLGGFS